VNLNEYQQLAHKTSAFAADETHAVDNIAMSILGLCGEVGEVADHFKKWQFHGHDLNLDKLSYELGDVLWYIAEACSALGFSLNSIAEQNIAKLQARYGDTFSSEASINRKD